MDNTTKLKFEERETLSKSARKQLRREGYLPCSISRKGEPSVSISLKKDEFRRAFGAIGMSGIYTLQSGRKKPHSAMIREIQYIPGTYEYMHITFQGISLTEETTADIPVHITGKEEVVHNGFEVLQQLEHVHLKGLPSDFPSAIEVDVSAMEAGEHLTVAQLQLPEGVQSLTEEDRLVLSVSYPKIRKEDTDGDEAADTDAAETTAAPAESAGDAE